MEKIYFHVIYTFIKEKCNQWVFNFLKYLCKVSPEQNIFASISFLLRTLKSRQFSSASNDGKIHLTNVDNPSDYDKLGKF